MPLVSFDSEKGKTLITSKVFWGVVATAITVFAPHLSAKLDEGWANEVAEIAAMLFTIWARFTAVVPITGILRAKKNSDSSGDNNFGSGGGGGSSGTGTAGASLRTKSVIGNDSVTNNNPFSKSGRTGNIGSMAVARRNIVWGLSLSLALGVISISGCVKSIGSENPAEYKSRQRAIYTSYGAIAVGGASEAVDILVTAGDLSKQSGLTLLAIAEQTDLVILEVANSFQAKTFDGKLAIAKIDAALDLIVKLEQSGVGNIKNPQSEEYFLLLVELTRTGLTAVKNFITIGKPATAIESTAIMAKFKSAEAKSQRIKLARSTPVQVLSLIRILVEVQGKINSALLLNTAAEGFDLVRFTIAATTKENSARIERYKS